MKKKLLTAIIAFIAITMSSSAYAQVSQEAAGTYNGTLTVSQDGNTMGKLSAYRCKFLLLPDLLVRKLMRTL